MKKIVNCLMALLIVLMFACEKNGGNNPPPDPNDTTKVDTTDTTHVDPPHVDTIKIDTTFISNGMINIIIEGQSYYETVRIPRDEPTLLKFRNNLIVTTNEEGYLLQAGDESPGSENNMLDDEIVTGNKLVWLGTNSNSIITHGLFVGYNINSVVKYNYLQDVPYGIIFKSGTDDGHNMTFTSGGCSYNITKNGHFGGRVKGINGVKFTNNTFYNGDGSGWYLLLITANMDRVTPAGSKDIKVYNNIFYSSTQIPMIAIESGSLSGFESDYNIFWCEDGDPIFRIEDTNKTWAQWQALGYDQHSVVINPNFEDNYSFIPKERLDFGKDLGVGFDIGISVDNNWTPGVSTITTKQQGMWQVGAVIY